MAHSHAMNLLEYHVDLSHYAHQDNPIAVREHGAMTHVTRNTTDTSTL